MTERHLKTADEAIAEVLGRFTVTDLVEQTDEDLERADEPFYRSDAPIQIIAQGETNLIKWWQIRSGGKHYEVRRFKNFVWCSCLAFLYRKKMCKHAAFTTGVYCKNCRVLAAKVGKLCYDCDLTMNRFQVKGENNESSTGKN